MTIKLPKNIKYILSKLIDTGFEAFVVGGAVRDSLLGLKPKDYDITTSATPNEVKDVFKDHLIIETGLKHGTVTIVVDKENIEVTTFRYDGAYKDGRHPESVIFTKSLKEDVARRDFTINAIACDINGKIIDYFNGQDDIKNKILRCVGDPTKRFNEDALRILRALRFATHYDLTIETETLNSLCLLFDNLSLISKERIRDELCKIISDYNFREDLFCILIQHCHVIDSQLTDYNIYQNSPYHRNQYLWLHVMNVIKNTDIDLITRLAALFHDIGKKDCLKYDEKKQYNHFIGHADKGSDICRNIMTRLHFTNTQIDQVCWLVKKHDNIITENKSCIKKLLNSLIKHNLPLDLFDKLINLKNADILDHVNSNLLNINRLLQLRDEILDSNECFDLKHLAIDGNDLVKAGFKGKQIGYILDKSLQFIIKHPDNNNKNDLFKYIKTLKIS